MASDMGRIKFNPTSALFGGTEGWEGEPSAEFTVSWEEGVDRVSIGVGFHPTMFYTYMSRESAVELAHLLIRAATVEV